MFKKYALFGLLFLLLTLSACNNKMADAPSGFWAWTWGDVEAETTIMNEAARCAEQDLNLISIDAKGNGTCGKGEAIVNMDTIVCGDKPSWASDGEATCNRTTSEWEPVTVALDVETEMVETSELEVKEPAKVTSDSACPTDEEMQQALNFVEDIRPVFTGEGIDWDGCKWNWQAYATTESISMTVPTGYLATLTRKNGEVQVWRGPATINDVAGFTLRFTPAYEEEHWVHDDCALLSQEIAFGLRREPAYGTSSGNLICKTEPVEIVDGTSTSCPDSVEQVAAIVGGNPDQWTVPDWSGGAWVFKSDGSFVTLNVPSIDGQTWIDYWNGEIGAADRLEVGESLALSDASFHCK